MVSSRSFLQFILIVVLGVSLSACGLFGSDDDSGASLGGDLSWRVEGQEGLTVQISRGYYDGSSFNFSTVESADLSGGSASGDLEDGDYTGYQLQASPYGGSSSASLTLQLLSDGDVLEETSEPNENGIWMVEVGEMPSSEDFQ